MQVDINLKLLLIKSNPVVFLLIAKFWLVWTFKSSVGKCSLVVIHSSLSLLRKDVHAESISDVLRDLVVFVQLKKCEKPRWRNATFSKFAGLHYSWKYHIKRNVNSFYCNCILIVSRINRSHHSRAFTFQKNIFICFIQSSLKVTKNAFYFILKTLFVLMIFKFLSSLFDHVGKTAWLER